jgi:hypothetical protein
VAYCESNAALESRLNLAFSSASVRRELTVSRFGSWSAAASQLAFELVEITGVALTLPILSRARDKLLIP